MADTLSSRQVDGCNEVGGEEHAELTVIGGGPYCEVFAAEGVGDLPVASLEGDVALGGRHLAGDGCVLVVRPGELRGHGPGARPVTAGGHGGVQRRMRALGGVEVAQ